MRITLAERFWKKVDQSGGDDACWPWIASFRSERGYGSFDIAGETCSAHVVAMELTSGEKANGRFALHHCDNPPCCNLSHLFWGTNQDNSDDKVRKLRHRFGETHRDARLSEIDVLAIRARFVPYDKLHSAGAIAKDYGVSRSTIYGIVYRQKWKHTEVV